MTHATVCEVKDQLQSIANSRKPNMHTELLYKLWLINQPRVFLSKLWHRHLCLAIILHWDAGKSIEKSELKQIDSFSDFQQNLLSISHIMNFKIFEVFLVEFVLVARIWTFIPIDFSKFQWMIGGNCVISSEFLVACEISSEIGTFDTKIWNF